MNQITYKIKLYELAGSHKPFGSEWGHDVFKTLCQRIDEVPDVHIFEISLDEIHITDTSFARESVMSIAKKYSQEKSFYLTCMMDNRDLIENWESAANFKKTPLVIWKKHEFKIIGPKISASNLECVEYVLTRDKVTASEIADKFKITVPNSSTKLKKLAQQGYIQRVEDVAESGGIEFVYSPIK